MAKTIKVPFDERLKERTIAFCIDELGYHVHDCDYPHEYHGEILAEIELLYRLGVVRKAKEYKQAYVRVLTQEVKDECDLHYKKELRKDVKEMKQEIKELWESLTA